VLDDVIRLAKLDGRRIAGKILGETGGVPVLIVSKCEGRRSGRGELHSQEDRIATEAGDKRDSFTVEQAEALAEWSQPLAKRAADGAGFDIDPIGSALGG